MHVTNCTNVNPPKKMRTLELPTRQGIERFETLDEKTYGQGGINEGIALDSSMPDRQEAVRERRRELFRARCTRHGDNKERGKEKSRL